MRPQREERLQLPSCPWSSPKISNKTYWLCLKGKAQASQQETADSGFNLPPWHLLEGPTCSSGAFHERTGAPTASTTPVSCSELSPSPRNGAKAAQRNTGPPSAPPGARRRQNGLLLCSLLAPGQCRHSEALGSPSEPLAGAPAPSSLRYWSRTRYLVDKADGGSLTAIEKLHVDDLELFQADVKSL